MSLLAEVPLNKQSGSPSRVGARQWSVGLTVALLIGCAASELPEPAVATVTVLAQGAPLHGSNGIYFGPDGRLYVDIVTNGDMLTYTVFSNDNPTPLRSSRSVSVKRRPSS